MSGMWKRSHGRTSEAPPDERGGYRYVRPTATAPHLDSTLLGHSVCRKMLVSTRTPAPRPLSLARLTHDRGYHCRVGAASLSSAVLAREVAGSTDNPDQRVTVEHRHPFDAMVPHQLHDLVEGRSRPRSVRVPSGLRAIASVPLVSGLASAQQIGGFAGQRFERQ